MRANGTACHLKRLPPAKTIADALGVSLNAAVLGAAVESLAKEAAAYPVAKVISVQNELLAQYTPDGYTAALEQLIKSSKTEAVVFPHTYQVRDYAPKLATRFGQAFVSDVVDIKSEGGKISFVRQLFQGKLNAVGRSQRRAQSSFRCKPVLFERLNRRVLPRAVETFAPQLDAAKIRSKPEEPFREAQRSVDLAPQN